MPVGRLRRGGRKGSGGDAAPGPDDLAALRAQGWALPPALARDDVVPTWTRTGVVDGARAALVDDRGLVTPVRGPGRPSLDWWVGAEDRWHVPAREVGVTQRRLEGAPVVETTLRVPGGEVVHRAFGARGPAHPGGDDWVVVEVENRSALPVALAWVVRPYDPTGATGSAAPTLSVASDAFPGGPRLLAAPEPFGLLPRPPSRWARGAAGADPLAVVEAGDAATGEVGAPDPDDPGPHGLALLTPLPHTATTRVVLFASPVPAPALEDQEVLWPERLPEAVAVARGWTTLVDPGPRVELPDPVLAEAVAAARRSLPLAHRLEREAAATDQEQPPARHRVTTGDAGPADRTTVGEAMEALAALAWWGDTATTDRALVSWPAGQERGGGFGRPEDTAAALRALAAHATASGDVGPASAWLPEVGGAIESLGRAARRPAEGTDPLAVAEGLDAGALLLAGLDQGEAAARVAAHAADVRAGAPWSAPAPVGSGPPPAPRQVAGAVVAALRAGEPAPDLWAVLRAASPTTTWSDPTRWVGDDGLVVVRLLDAVARLLVRDDPDGPTLVPWMPPAWWGLGWEVHRAPTRWGHLSYAVRWHSGRPAVLWELGDPLDGVVGTPVLTAPGLDPSWRATEARGEALLMPVPVPDDHPAAADPGAEPTGGVAVAAPPRSVWRPQDPGPDAPPAAEPGPPPRRGAGDPPADPPPDGGSFS